MTDKNAVGGLSDIFTGTAAALIVAIAGCMPLAVLFLKGGAAESQSVLFVSGGAAAAGIAGALAAVRHGARRRAEKEAEKKARWDGAERRRRAAAEGWSGAERRTRPAEPPQRPEPEDRRPSSAPSAGSFDDPLCERIMGWHRIWASTLAERRTEAMLAEGDLLNRRADDIVRRRLAARFGEDGLAASAALDRLKGWNSPDDRRLVAVLLRHIDWTLSPDLRDTVTFRLYETRRGARTWDFEGEGRGKRRNVQEAFAQELWLWSRGGPLPPLEERATVEGGSREDVYGSQKPKAREEVDPRSAQKPGAGLDGAARLHLAVLGLNTLPADRPALLRAVEACALKPERRIEPDVERVAIKRAKTAVGERISDPKAPPPADADKAGEAVDKLSRRTLMRLEVMGLLFMPDEKGLKAAYRRRQLESHPDHGGTHDEAVAVNQAHDALLKGLRERSAN